MDTHYAEKILINHHFKTNPVMRSWHRPVGGGYFRADISQGIVEVRSFDRLGLPTMETVRFNVNADDNNCEDERFADYLNETFKIFG